MFIKTFKYSFKHSFPILIGFIPVGIAYGVLMDSSGYNALWTLFTSVFVLSGSLQFLLVDFFKSQTPLITVAVLAIVVGSRHIFYGISFIDKFRSFGWYKYFLIYSLADEVYTLHCSHNFGDDVDEKLAYVMTAGLVVFYWIALSFLGALIGSFIPFDLSGVDFALTALFIVLLIEQLKGAKNRLPAVIASISSIVCLAVLGPSNFILPSLVITVGIIMALRRQIESKKEVENE